VRSLLSKGENIETDDVRGQRAVHSVVEGRETLLRLLLSKHASIEAEDYDGNSALHYAAENGQVAVVTGCTRWTFPLRKWKFRILTFLPQRRTRRFFAQVRPVTALVQLC
jgi:hypothetical protein